MEKREQRRRRSFTPEFKAKTVELIRSSGPWGRPGSPTLSVMCGSSSWQDKRITAHPVRGKEPRIPVDSGQAASALASSISRLRCLMSKAKWPPLTVTSRAPGIPR